MFKRRKNLLLVFSAFVMLVIVSIGVSNAEEFADGKYFASVTDSYNVRWHIIVEKSGSSLKVISLNSEAFKAYDKLMPAVDLTEKLGTLELDEDLEYDTGWIRYIYDWKFRFYGKLGRFSKTQMTAYSGMIEESRFKYQPYKFYDSFQRALLLNPELTTKNFEQSIYVEAADEAQEEADAPKKYFASLADKSDIRWNIIVEQTGRVLKVIKMETTGGKNQTPMTIVVPPTDLTENFDEIELGDEGRYDSSWVKFFSNKKVRFFGKLEEKSTLSYFTYSREFMNETRFTFVSYKYYEAFQQAFLVEPDITTKNFEHSIYAQNVDKEAAEGSKSVDEAALKMKELELREKELELELEKMRLEKEAADERRRIEEEAADERRRIEEEAELEEKLKRETEERKIREEKERKAAEEERIKQEKIAKKKAEEAEKERIKQEKIAKKKAEEAEKERKKQEEIAERKAAEAEKERKRQEEIAKREAAEAEKERKRQEEIARIEREQEEEMRKIRARIAWSISDVNDLVSDIDEFLKSHKDEVDILTLVELYKPVKGLKKGSDIQAEDKRNIELLENFLLKNVNFKNFRDEVLREREIERLQLVEEERGHLKSALDYALNYIIEHPLDDNIFELTVLYEENIDVDRFESLNEIEQVYNKLILEFEKIGIKEEYTNQ